MRSVTDLVSKSAILVDLSHCKLTNLQAKVLENLLNIIHLNLFLRYLNLLKTIFFFANFIVFLQPDSMPSKRSRWTLFAFVSKFFCALNDRMDHSKICPCHQSLPIQYTIKNPPMTCSSLKPANLLAQLKAERK